MSPLISHDRTNSVSQARWLGLGLGMDTLNFILHARLWESRFIIILTRVCLIFFYYYEL